MPLIFSCNFPSIEKKSGMSIYSSGASGIFGFFGASKKSSAPEIKSLTSERTSLKEKLPLNAIQLIASFIKESKPVLLRTCLNICMPSELPNFLNLSIKFLIESSTSFSTRSSSVDKINS